MRVEYVFRSSTSRLRVRVEYEYESSTYPVHLHFAASLVKGVAEKNSHEVGRTATPRHDVDVHEIVDVITARVSIKDKYASSMFGQSFATFCDIKSIKEKTHKQY